MEVVIVVVGGGGFLDTFEAVLFRLLDDDVDGEVVVVVAVEGIMDASIMLHRELGSTAILQDNFKIFKVQQNSGRVK